MKKRGYSPISGAYYSAPLAVCEYLSQVKRSARVLALRNISSEYRAPLGTWAIREATRKTMAHPSVICESLAAAVGQASAPVGADSWVSHSTLMPELRMQRTLMQSGMPVAILTVAGNAP